AVSIVKNEADIIEAFVRHTRAWVDHHLVFDHDSTDGTREILGALQREGLPLSLFTDDALGNLQHLRSNHLARVAARDHAADWVLPLDADEILTGPDRPALEQTLAKVSDGRPATLPLVNYYPTAGDDASVANPILRLRHCQAAPARTKKIMVPRSLALDPGIQAGKGSHALYRGAEMLPDDPLPPEYYLAHLALRSPQHQVLRVVLPELQKLSRGRAHAGLDEHYRLGFQLLAENPDLFFATVCPAAAGLRRQPIAYRGEPLRHSQLATGWNRVAMALLPYLEKLAASHGRLLDAAGATAPENSAGNAAIRPLGAEDISPRAPAGSIATFAGFVARQGWGPEEGPVPEAFLPPFHWGYAPSTELTIHSRRPREARFAAEALTYSEGQVVNVELNGAPVLRHAFGRVNQKELLTASLPLRAGDNQLTLRYDKFLRTEHDPRQLAAIFLSLRLEAEIA
ncbi:MAG: hypothetical protein JWQ62_1717, partial [Lacunisphaera sp.]|nr:hypothetical protein [Lacunisphaera sp.]